eukprot:5274536-Amphidinium_carterae.2
MYHLEINYKPSKSEATLALCQPEAKAMMQGLKQVGRARRLPGPALAITEDVSLIIAQAYAHLGCMHMQDLNLRMEVAQMLSRARAALRDKKVALRSKSIGLKSRVGVHSIYVRCHLLQNVAILQPFQQGQLQRLQAEYLRGLRICAHMEVKHGDDFKYSNAQVLDKCNVPALSVLMDKRVLAFFAKLVVTDNILVRAAITVSFAEHSMWMRVTAALNNLLAYFPVALSALPAATRATLGVWAQYSILHSAHWRELVRTYGNPVRGGDAGTAAAGELVVPPAGAAPGPDGHGVHLAPDDDEAPAVPQDEVAAPVVTFDCELCDYKGKTFTGLQAHRRRSHQIHTPLSLRIASPQCDCCDLNFGTRARILDHMRQSKRCANYVLAHVEPLTPRSFAAMMERNRHLDESGSRPLLPKPGPKPKGERPPTCSYTPVFLDENQRLASIPQLD